MVSHAWPLPLIDKGFIQKITAVDFTVASTGIFLLFPSFFASTRTPITFSRPNIQGASFLHAAPPPLHRRTQGPYEIAIKTLNIWDGRGCGLEQAIREVDIGGLDLMALVEKIRTEACSKNRRGYDVMCAAACPPAPVEHRAAWGWGCKTGPTSGGASPRDSTGRK